jgi:membrane-associated protein
MKNINSFSDLIQFLLNADEIISEGGLAAVCLIVFAETGLFFCFFLPGDYLLFLAGVLCATHILKVHIITLTASIFLAAILGNFTAYFFGKQVGEKLYNRPDSLFFKRRYIESTKEFFEKYGGNSLIIGRFLPIIRTFAPILAGAAQMDFRLFTKYNIMGGALWSFGLVLSGFFLGYEFPQIIEYIQYIILFFLAITSITVIRAYLKIRKDHKAKEQ